MFRFVPWLRGTVDGPHDFKSRFLILPRKAGYNGWSEATPSGGIEAIPLFSITDPIGGIFGGIPEQGPPNVSLQINILHRRSHTCNRTIPFSRRSPKLAQDAARHGPVGHWARTDIPHMRHRIQASSLSLPIALRSGFGHDARRFRPPP